MICYHYWNWYLYMDPSCTLVFFHDQESATTGDCRDYRLHQLSRLLHCIKIQILISYFCKVWLVKPYEACSWWKKKTYSRWNLQEIESFKKWKYYVTKIVTAQFLLIFYYQLATLSSELDINQTSLVTPSLLTGMWGIAESNTSNW